MGKENTFALDRRAFIKLAATTAGASIACNFPIRIINDGKTSQGNDRLLVKLDDFALESTEPVETEQPVTSEPTPDSRTYFEKYVYPALQAVANERRSQKALQDTDFWNRVDRDLNRDRINFALLGLGSEKSLTDSIQIMSLEPGKNEIRTVSIQRDTQAPEISRFKNTTRTYRINQAHSIGSMPLVETVLEDATGLSADFVVVMNMDVLPQAVEEVFGDSLEVCVPWEIEDSLMGDFPQGLQTLNGEEVLSLSRARYYANNAARNTIQQYVMRAMFARSREEFSKGGLSAIGLTLKSILFFEKATRNGTIRNNFDSKLFIDIGEGLVKQISEQGLPKDMQGVGMPTLSARYAIQAESAGYEKDKYLKKPLGGNPNASDLISNYWQNARVEISDFLQRDTSDLGFEKEAVCGIANE